MPSSGGVAFRIVMAMKAALHVKGLRFRSGNVQVGDNSLLEELFSEPRFNAWSIGEIHVLDQRIIPNGRRDQFEQSVHYDNLLNQLAPFARDLSRRCRASSAERKLQRDFEFHESVAKEKISIIAQGTLTKSRQSKLVREVQRSIAAMEKIATHISQAGSDLFVATLPEQSNRDLFAVVMRLKAKLKKLSVRSEASPFDELPPKKRERYQHLFDLIYDCSINRVAAKALIDRIIQKIL